MSSQTGKSLLEVRGVGKRFGASEVLADVSFSMVDGEVLCVCGPNGAGKSTLVRILLRTLEPDGGSVACPSASDVGYVPQYKRFDRNFPATVEELIVANIRGRWPFRIRARERKVVASLLERVALPGAERKSLATLSGGELQRTFLARALASNPKLLILDEPETGVDVVGRSRIGELLRVLVERDGVGSLVVTHDPKLMAACADRVLYLDKKIVADGTPAELFGRADLPLIADRSHLGTTHAE